VRRRDYRRSPHDDTHDRWLVSYSDFIMLLFAFFVVLFSSTYRDNRAIPAVSSAIHSGFRDMGAFSAAEGEGTGTPVIPHGGTRSNIDGDEQTAQPASTSAEIITLKRQLEVTMAAELRSHELTMRMTPEGVVISLNELGFFDSGSATLLPGAATKIQRIADLLSSHGLNLRIEGHSDDQPIHNSQYRSNWELSTSRALAVLMLLVRDSASDPAKLSVAGHGEYRPVATNATPEGRTLNRRVDIVVLAPVRVQ
jgi:chemotaxis protein MotB